MSHKEMTIYGCCAYLHTGIFAFVGYGSIMEYCLKHSCLRIVKHIAEEDPEFFDYALCFVSTLFYRRSF